MVASKVPINSLHQIDIEVCNFSDEDIELHRKCVIADLFTEYNVFDLLNVLQNEKCDAHIHAMRENDGVKVGGDN